MKPLVNYKKRKFTLPPGCKNLIDVLEPSRRQAKEHHLTGWLSSPQLREERFATAGLAHIGRFMSMLLHSRKELFQLSIIVPGFQFPVAMYRHRSEQIAAIVLVTKDSQLEQAIRSFFEQGNLQAISDDQDVETPDAPRCLAYPLPSEAAHAISLTTGLLRSVYRLSEEAGLVFRYIELENIA